MNRHTQIAPELCQICNQLTREWRIAAKHEADAVTETGVSLNCASLDEYEASVAGLAERHQRTEAALAALNKHRESHGG